MLRTRRFEIGLALAFAFFIGLPFHSEAEGQDRGVTVWIPMQDKGFFSTREIRLEATLYKPQGDGPFAVIIFNHGSTGPGVVPVDRTENPSGLGAYLLKKDIALLIPMRRGRGKSEGTYMEPYDCSLHQSRWGINYAMESLDAAHSYLAKQPWADMSKILLSGSSRGGILSVVYAAERPGSSIGVLNFVGGWMSDSCNLRAGTDINAAIFKEAGTKSRVPNLFLYAANDSYYSVSSIEKYPEAFREGGGAVEYKLYTLSAGVDGHSLFYRHSTRWIPDVDAFLTKVGVWKP
jgi:dienelactone hydrolase